MRESFVAAREFADLVDLNAQARLWCEGAASHRRCPEEGALSVRQAFEVDRASLMALPVQDYPLGERMAVQMGKTPNVRFDLNDFPVPHAHVGRTLAVLADEARMRVFDGAAEIPRHARGHCSVDRVARAVPATSKLLAQAAERSEILDSITAALLRRLDRYGAAALQIAP